MRSETDLVFTEEGDGDEGDAGDEEEDLNEEEEVEKFFGRALRPLHGTFSGQHFS